LGGAFYLLKFGLPLLFPHEVINLCQRFTTLTPKTRPSRYPNRF
jgi:hypothetical protein